MAPDINLVVSASDYWHGQESFSGFFDESPEEEEE